MKHTIQETIKSFNAIGIGNDIAIYEQIFSEQVFSMHWHNFYEFEMILDGEGEVIFNNKSYTVKRGLTSLVTPTDFHEIRIKNSLHLLCIQFTVESINKEIVTQCCSRDNNIFFSSEEQISRTIAIFNLLRDNFIPGTAGQMYLSRLLETLLLSFKTDFKSVSPSHAHISIPIQKAIIYLDSHFKENPKMADVASMLFLNEHYFCTLFKKNMGESYKEYLRKLKLSHAKKLILHTTIPITHVAIESGYSSQSNFNRDFKKHFNISPNAMRRQISTYDS